MEKTIITIAGNMGVGKTALTTLLAREMGWEPFFEAVEDNPYIADFYKDMGRWGFHSQLFYLVRRLRFHREMLSHPSPIIVQDRGVFEDAEVFAKNLYKEGHITERDYGLYRELYLETAHMTPMPGFVVYLKASVPTLQKRLALRGKDYEQSVSREYLARLNELYDAWIEEFTLCPVVVIPVDELDFVEHPEHFKKVRDQVVRALEVWKQQRLTL